MPLVFPFILDQEARPNQRERERLEEEEAQSSPHVSGGIKKGAKLGLLKSNLDLVLDP